MYCIQNYILLMCKWWESLESDENERKIFQPENNGHQVGKLVERTVAITIRPNVWNIITIQSHTRKCIRGKADILW